MHEYTTLRNRKMSRRNTALHNYIGRKKRDKLETDSAKTK